MMMRMKRILENQRKVNQIKTNPKAKQRHLKRPQVQKLQIENQEEQRSKLLSLNKSMAIFSELNFYNISIYLIPI